MAALRVLWQSRHALSKGLTAHLAATSVYRIAIATVRTQHFSSSRSVQEEIVKTPAAGVKLPFAATQGTPTGNNARSIAIANLAREIVPADIETLLRNAGLDM